MARIPGVDPDRTDRYASEVLAGQENSGSALAQSPTLCASTLNLPRGAGDVDRN